MKTITIVAVWVGLAPLAGWAAAPAMQPFSVDWHAAADSPASVAFLLEKPAGAGGLVRTAGGHLVDGHGRRLRLWGINATGGAALPPKEQAPLIAAHLARCGINCVRFHMLDRPAPGGILEAGRDDTSRLAAQPLDRLDFFVAELKKLGIYTDLNLNVAHGYKAGDGVKSAELLGFAKVVNYFDPTVQKLHRRYAEELLTHKNAYTGQEYRHEPAVALVEMVNENSIVEAWVCGRLLGQATHKNPGTWTDIPADYEAQLTDLYDAWLRKTLPADELARIHAAAKVPAGQAVPRLQPREFAQADRGRFLTEARFYVELERDYFAGMGRHLRDELHVEPLLLGTADHNHGKSGYPLISSTAQLDVVDGHVYWQHPKYAVDPRTGRNIGFSITNTPMVDDPRHSTPVELSRSAVAGKPYIVSEVNHPFPAEYACEGIPILAAYAAFQDWDGLFWYTLGHVPVADAPQKIAGHFDLYGDPVKMSQLAAGALLFVRGDVARAKETRGRSYSREQVLESLRLPSSESPYFTPGFPLDLPLRHAVRITSLDAPAGGGGEGAAEATKPLVTIEAPNRDARPAAVDGGTRSDTGELIWLHAGQVVIDTPRWQAVVGHFGLRLADTGNMYGEIKSPFAAITLSSLDAQPIDRTGRLLLTVTARAANHGMRFNAARTTLEDWGQAPVEIEPVQGDLQLQSLEGAKAVRVQPLDGAGRPLGSPLAAAPVGGNWRVPLGHPATTWYTIDVQR